MRLFISLALLFASSAAVSAQTELQFPVNRQNATFLSRRFISDTKNAALLTADFVTRSQSAFDVQLLFPNGGLLGSTGNLDHAPFAAAIFLQQVQAQEGKGGPPFRLLPYLNGYSLQDSAHPANLRVDIGDPAVRANIVAECGRYVSPKVSGSYVAGSSRVFDGVLLDIEPAGDPAFLASLKLLFNEIRASFDGMGLKGKTIGFSAPQFTTRIPKPNWGWDSTDYYSLARNVNYLIAMTYDSSLQNDQLFQEWMSAEAIGIMDSVSGAAWKNDPFHPAPNNGVKVFFGLPGFHTATKAHNPNVENIALAAPALRAGLTQVQKKSPSAIRYFGGAAMFAHDGGDPTSIYARYDSDWMWWKQKWIGP